MVVPPPHCRDPLEPFHLLEQVLEQIRRDSYTPVPKQRNAAFHAMLRFGLWYMHENELWTELEPFDGKSLRHRSLDHYLPNKNDAMVDQVYIEPWKTFAGLRTYPNQTKVKFDDQLTIRVFDPSKWGPSNGSTHRLPPTDQV